MSVNRCVHFAYNVVIRSNFWSDLDRYGFSFISRYLAIGLHTRFCMQRSHNPWVVGSSPTRPTKTANLAVSPIRPRSASES